MNAMEKLRELEGEGHAHFNDIHDTSCFISFFAFRNISIRMIELFDSGSKRVGEEE